MFPFELFRGRRHDARGDGKDWLSGPVVTAAHQGGIRVSGLWWHHTKNPVKFLHCKTGYEWVPYLANMAQTKGIILTVIVTFMEFGSEIWDVKFDKSKIALWRVWIKNLYAIKSIFMAWVIMRGSVFCFQ